MPSYKDQKTGKWYVSFYYTDPRGKRVRKVKRGFSLKREADKWERDFLSSDHPEEITMHTLISEYKDYIQTQFRLGNIKESTMVAKLNRVRLYIEPYFNEELASKIKAANIEKWMADITIIELRPLKTVNYYYRDRPEAERKTRRSSRTINQARAEMKQLFDNAMKNHGLKENPVGFTRRVKKFSQDTRAKMWSVEEYNKFRSMLTRADMIVMFDILFYAGLRIGELMTLTPNDISQYQINVSKTLVQLSYNETRVGTPKSENSTRIVQIPKFLYQEIEEYIKHCFDQKNEEPIFNVQEQTIRIHLNANAKKAGVPRVSPHSLRHSYASHLLKVTGDVTTVASQMGDTPDVVVKTYAHMVWGSDREAADAFESYIEQKK